MHSLAQAALHQDGTIGRVVGAMELRIIDDAGNDVPHGEIGEIAALGPTVHLGYHNNPSANASAFIKGGWFRTGDLGRYVDAQNNVQITGRSKEIINRGGEKISAEEIERLNAQIAASNSSALPYALGEYIGRIFLSVRVVA